MTNAFKDVQYRDLVGKPGWQEPEYIEWADVPANIQTFRFGSGTQFRMKPKTTYTVTYIQGAFSGISTTYTHQDALNTISRLLEESAENIHVKKEETSK